MPGFIATIGTSIKVASSREENIVSNSISDKNYYIEHRANKKFANDKFLFENDNFIFLLDGVILNNHQLIDKYECSEWKACVIKMHSLNPLTFYNEFRGSFLGAIYNKLEDTWLFYTDHIGDKQIFYSRLDDGGWLIGTEMSYMVDTYKMNNLILTPDRDAAYMVITLGYTIEDKTLVNEIKKVVAGHYLTVSESISEEFQYHRFSNKPIDITEELAIEKIDEFFRKAVKLQFEKDKEYGYKHVAGLSGGLDSRMVVWVAHELGYKEQLNMTFCQSNYTDFKIAQQIATDLRHEFIFKALDSGNCIYSLDDVSHITYGMACFFGLAHCKSMFDNFNYNAYGIVHTGMVGDVIIGSFLKEPKYGIEHHISNASYSTELIHKLSDYKFKYDYEDREIYQIYNRGFGFCGQGTLSYDHTQTENFSPFCDVDFMEFCLSIPLEMRCHHDIYLKWILSRYPNAGNYIWETSGMLVKDSFYKEVVPREIRYMNVLGFKVPHFTDPTFLDYLKAFILRRLGLRKKIGKQIQQEEKNNTFMLTTENNMNPVDYWYYGNSDLRSFMDSYWFQNKNVVKDEQLLKDLTYLYEECLAVYDKLQPLTLLSAYKLIFE